MARLKAVVAAVFLGAMAPLATSAALVACGEPKVAKPAAPVVIQAEQAIDPRAPIVLSLRPMALRRDEVFGPLVTTLSRLAASRGVTGTRELEAFESAEELRIAIDEASSDTIDGKMSGIVVVRGTRADLVPEKILDGDGKLLFKSGRASGEITEHEGYAEEPLSLFVLPRRTWVIALGAAASRARIAFAEARRAPRVPFDDAALLELRIDGKNLVKHVPKLERGELAIGRRLADATLRLMPSRGGLVLLLTYADVDAAAWAENTLVRIANAFSRKLEGPLAWLGGTTVVREGTLVRLRAEVPAEVVDALKRIDAAELLAGRFSESTPTDAGAPASDAAIPLDGGTPAAQPIPRTLPNDAGPPPPKPAPARPPADRTSPKSRAAVTDGGAPASPPSPWKLTFPTPTGRDAGVDLVH